MFLFPNILWYKFTNVHFEFPAVAVCFLFVTPLITTELENKRVPFVVRDLQLLQGPEENDTRHNRKAYYTVEQGYLEIVDKKKKKRV